MRRYVSELRWSRVERISVVARREHHASGVALDSLSAGMIWRGERPVDAV